jgi:hypothetical protein
MYVLKLIGLIWEINTPYTLPKLFLTGYSLEWQLELEPVEALESLRESMRSLLRIFPAGDLGIDSTNTTFLTFL